MSQFHKSIQITEIKNLGSLSQYDYRRRLALKKFSKSVEPFEKFLMKGNTTAEAIRISKVKTLPPTAKIDLADNDYFIDVIAPYLEGAKSHERFANISIYRFRYALPGMHPKEEQTHTDTSAKTNNIHKLWHPVFLFFCNAKFKNCSRGTHIKPYMRTG